MLKKLLTLLAILTGLTALGTPAQARFASVENTQIAAFGEGLEQALPVAAAQHVIAEVAPRKQILANAVYVAPVTAIAAPTVRLPADRARE